MSRFRTSPKSLSEKFVDISWVRWIFVTYIRGYQLFPINPSPSSQRSCQMSNDCLARPRVPTLLPPLFLQCIRRDGSCTQMNVGKGSCAPPGLRRFKKRVHLPHSFFHPFVASWGHQGSHEKPRRFRMSIKLILNDGMERITAQLPRSLKFTRAGSLRF